ncbi:MAG: hypothetical protein V3R62_12925, partial [Acidiferrobacterales bacterium]
TVLSITENVYSSLAWLPPEELVANEKNAVHRSTRADGCFAGFAESRACPGIRPAACGNSKKRDFYSAPLFKHLRV